MPCVKRDTSRGASFRAATMCQSDGAKPLSWKTTLNSAVSTGTGNFRYLPRKATFSASPWKAVLAVSVEREGESAYYFKQFSERTAYPLAINIIFYVMTH